MKRIYTKLFILFLLLSSGKVFSQGGLKINEIDYDQIQLDSTEFIELYNSSSTAIDLSLYKIQLINGNGGTPYNDSLFLPSVMLNPASFFVICGSLNYVPLCDYHLTVPRDILQNGSPDAIVLTEISSGNIIDALSYEGTIPGYVEGTGLPPGIATSDSGIANYKGLSRFPDGADTDDNSQDFHLVCITPGTANVSDTGSGCMSPDAVPVIKEKTTNLSIFPNPSRGVSIVDLKGVQLNNSSLIIYNVLGKEIKTMSLKNTETFHQMDLSDLQDGIYYVKLKTGHGEKTQRIILRK